MRGGAGAPSGVVRHWATGILCAGLIVGVLSAGAVAVSYTDTFDASPWGAGTTGSFTTGTAATGLSYSADCNVLFAWEGTGKIDCDAIDCVPPFEASFTIASRDGKTFVFNSLDWDDDAAGATITGSGPEPFTITVGSGGSGTFSPPGGSKLVTSVTVSSTDMWSLLDNVSVELDAPGMDVQGNGTTIANGDSTPSSGDDTNMGSTLIGTPITKTFTIRSIGDASLDLTGSPYVTLTGSGDFTITAQPTTDPIASGGSDSFTVQCTPSSPGVRTATVSIANDSAANPYTFTVQAEGTGTPEISVERPASNTIADGGTDAQGSKTAGTQVTLTYTVRNTGNVALSVTGITGAAASNVTVDSIAPTTLTVAADGGTDTFDVKYTPTDGGAFSFELDITNTDADEGNYDITVSGTGTAPEINVERPAGTAIADGGTDLQGLKKADEQLTLTYTVRNTGAEALNVTNITSAAASDATVHSIAPTSFTVSPGGGTATFDVLYTPTATSWGFSFELDITNDDVTEGNYDITVSGAGDGDPPTFAALSPPASSPYKTEDSFTISVEIHDMFSGTDRSTVVADLSQLGGGAAQASDSEVGMTYGWDITVGALTDGVKTYSIDAMDNVGNAGQIVGTVRIDNTDPVTTAGAGPSSASNDSGPTFAFTATDTDGSGVASSSATLTGPVSAGPTTVTSGFALSGVLGRALATNGTEDGLYTMSVVSTDNAGNEETTATWTWTYDSQPPVKPATPDLAAASDTGEFDDDGVTNIDEPTLLGAAGSVEADATVSVTSSIDGPLGTTAANGSGIWSYTVPGASPLTEGTHDITITATDAAGNESVASDALSVLVDTTPPTVPTGMSPASGSYTSETSPILSWNASSDPGGSGLRSSDGYRYVVDGGSSGYTTAVTYQPGLAEGQFSWKIRARDVAGNNSAYTSDTVLYIDTTDPTDPIAASTSHTVGEASSDDTIDITIAGAVDPLSNGVSSGVDGFDCEWDKNPTWAATGVKDQEETWGGGTFTATSDGDWYFHIATCDNVGHWTATAHLGPFTIDTLRPTASSLTENLSMIAEADVGDKTFTLTIVYDEPMNAGIAPTVSFPAEDPTGTITLDTGIGGSGWSDSDTYVARYDVADVNAEIDLIDVRVTGAQDLAGNTQVQYDEADVFGIDTVEPLVTNVTIDTNPVCESDLTQQVTVVCSEAMNTTVVPTIVFSDGTWTEDVGSRAWSAGDTTFTVTYTLADNDEEFYDRTPSVDVVTVDVTGGKDATGNNQTDYAPQAEFDIDTLQPTMIDATSSASDGCYTIGATIDVDLTFSEDVVLGSDDLELILDVGGARAHHVEIGMWVVLTDTASGTYTAVAGESSCDLTLSSYETTVAGTLLDWAGNECDFELPATGSNIADQKAITIDMMGPAAVNDPNGNEDRNGSDDSETIAARRDPYDQYRLAIREDTPAYIDVKFNDSDLPCAVLLRIHDIPVPPEFGTAWYDDPAGTIRYAPGLGYTGPDEFTYRIRDACGNVSAEATVYIEVVPRLAVEDVYVTACSGEPEAFTVSAADLWVDYDPAVVPFLFEILGGPEHGIVTGDPTQVTLTPPSTVDVGGTPVPTLDFTETATIELTYTSAVGYTGRDTITIRFSDPFGNATTGRVDVRVIGCAGEVVGVADLVVRQGEILPIIVPEGFGAVLLIDLADGTEYTSALTVEFNEEIDRHVIYMDTGLLPVGLHLLVIPLGNGETVELTIEVGAPDP